MKLETSWTYVRYRQSMFSHIFPVLVFDFRSKQQNKCLMAYATMYAMPC